MKLFNKPSVYFVMGTQNVIEQDPLDVLEQALAAGISHFQLREKGPSALSGEKLLEFAWNCKRLCREYGVPLIVNDDVELAFEIEADGVHVGQEDEAAENVRRLIGEGKILGVSVHSIAEAELAVANGADYVGMGPVFGTQSKEDAKPPSGIEGIMAVKALFPHLPVIGIGGITPDNAGSVWSAGADSVAVISAITQANRIEEQVQRFKISYKEGAIK